MQFFVHFPSNNISSIGYNKIASIFVYGNCHYSLQSRAFSVVFKNWSPVDEHLDLFSSILQ